MEGIKILARLRWQRLLAELEGGRAVRIAVPDERDRRRYALAISRRATATATSRRYARTDSPSRPPRPSRTVPTDTHPTGVSSARSRCWHRRWRGWRRSARCRTGSPRTWTLLAGLAITAVIARKGTPAPLQAGKRWVIERTQSWMNGYGKLRRCTERNGLVVDCYLFLAAAFVVTRCLIRRPRTRYRWATRTTTRRLTRRLLPVALSPP